MVFENDWMVPFIISTATEISENASCGSQWCLYLPSLAYTLRSYLVRSGEKDLALFNLYHKAWSPRKNALDAKTSPLTRQLEEERWGKHMALITAAAPLEDEPVADPHAENSSTIRGYK